MTAVCIVEQPLEIKTWKGQRVVTFKDIDRVHRRPEGTASRNFRQNRKRFIENQDFFAVAKKELPTNFVANPKKGGNPNTLVTLITEMGYLMLVKSFTDDLAWKVQRALVNNYFRAPEAPVQQQLALKPERYLYNGSPVMTIRQISELTGCTPRQIWDAVNRYGVSHRVLRKEFLRNFKSQNQIEPSVQQLAIFYWLGVEAVLECVGQKGEHDDYLMQYFEPEHRKDLSDEDMRIAVEQTRLLLEAAGHMKEADKIAAACQAATVLLINVGLWDERHPGFNGVTANFWDVTPEGHNKNLLMHYARKRWPYEK